MKTVFSGEHHEITCNGKRHQYINTYNGRQEDLGLCDCKEDPVKAVLKQIIKDWKAYEACECAEFGLVSKEITFIDRMAANVDDAREALKKK